MKQVLKKMSIFKVAVATILSVVMPMHSVVWADANRPINEVQDRYNELLETPAHKAKLSKVFSKWIREYNPNTFAQERKNEYQQVEKNIANDTTLTPSQKSDALSKMARARSVFNQSAEGISLRALQMVQRSLNSNGYYYYEVTTVTVVGGVGCYYYDPGFAAAYFATLLIVLLVLLIIIAASDNLNALDPNERDLQPVFE